MSTKTNANQAIAQKVPDEERLEFLPQLFGNRYILAGETQVYNWMGRLCEKYQGGYWEFYRIPGSGFMAPSGTGNMELSWSGNCFEGEMSREAAGIVATLYALNTLANNTGEDHLIEAYYALRDFARSHAEANKILAAID